MVDDHAILTVFSGRQIEFCAGAESAMVRADRRALESVLSRAVSA